MSDVNLEKVRHLANLARITMSEQEVKHFTGNLTTIVEAVAAVSVVETMDIARTTHPMPLNNVYRDDVAGHVLDRERLLRQAPDSEDGKFKVPAILDED